LIVVALATAHKHAEAPLITKAHLEKLRTKATYKVFDYENHPFKGYTTAQLKAMLGLKRHPEHKAKKITYDKHDPKLPDSFDAREQWPNCVHEIRDQAQCGSCWAFAASEVLSDRFCIATNGKTDVILSPQDLVSCDTSDLGCSGGYLDKSWDYLKETGIVSDDCFPYTSQSGDVESCPNACTGTGKWTKFRATDYTQFTSSNQIKTSLVNEGPVETGFDVYDDFMSYESGIYVKNSDNMLGGHAVKVVGYGTEDGQDYWIVANSWGASWGETGFFRFATNQCGFDDDMIAGTPDTSNHTHLH